MAPRNKVRLCHSQITYRAKYERNSPKRGGLPHRDYSESILHRLRPRTKHADKALETMYVKKRGRRTRRKRTALLAKRSFTRKKHRCRNFTLKSTEDRSGGPISTSNVAAGNRKPASFLRAIRDYVVITFREGTKWAAECVFRLFGFVGKTQGGFRAPRRCRDAASFASRMVQGAQNGPNRERTRGRGPRSLNSHQGDGGGFPGGGRVRDFPENSYGKKTAGCTASRDLKDQRRSKGANFSAMRGASEINGRVFRKRGKLRSPYSSRRRRRKKNRFWSKRTPRNNSRFDEKAAKNVHHARRYEDVRESRVLMSLAEALDRDASKNNEPNEDRRLDRAENSDQKTMFCQVIALDEECVAKSDKRNKFAESSTGDRSTPENSIENN